MPILAVGIIEFVRGNTGLIDEHLSHKVIKLCWGLQIALSIRISATLTLKKD